MLIEGWQCRRTALTRDDDNDEGGGKRGGKRTGLRCSLEQLVWWRACVWVLLGRKRQRVEEGCRIKLRNEQDGN